MAARRTVAARANMVTPALTLIILSLAATGCLFTTNINTAPTVQIIAPTGSVGRGKPVQVSATAYDADGDSIRLEWSVGMGACPVTPVLSVRPPTTYQSPPGDPTFEVPVADLASPMSCVWVLATDDQGATGFATVTLMPEDQPPDAVITVLEPTATASNGLYELYSTFHLSAASSTDPDGDAIVMPVWRLIDMPQTVNPVPTLAPCRSAAPTALVQCLDVGGFAGKYTIGLTVSDGMKPSSEVTTTLFVDNDHPACVSKTDPVAAASPIVLDPGEARILTVTEILDDGSPLPRPVDGTHTPPTFQWKVSRNGGAPSTIAGYETFNAFTLPAGTYATGDEVVVTATISDGVAMHLDPACDPRCPAGCPQSASWTVDYR
jgi:hypothetical protein